MKPYQWPIQNDYIRRGPFPMRATIDAELHGPERQLADYRITSELGAHSLLPMFVELHVNAVDGENIPMMFAKAYDTPFAPLIQNEQGRGADRLPGLLCILPTPLKMGITAVAIRQRERENQYSVPLEWYMDRVELLATDPTTLVEQAPAGAFSWASPSAALKEHPDDPNTRVHMTDVGDIVSVIPTLTNDKKLQSLFEASLELRQKTAPDSLDSVKELVPGITQIYQEDGLSIRGNIDQLIGYDFAATAAHLGLNPSVGKATFTRFLRYIGNHELERISKQVSPEKLEKRTRKLYGAIETIAYRTGGDMLYDTEGRRYRYQLAVDFDAARDLALTLTSGRLKLPGIGQGSIAILRSLFDDSHVE
ncbi:MAG: hypothetical protein JWO99_413 [Candidatus Saccharibacteria bacterium]|nr:hypothetical protein [Candidatus Saccharibacteria bacterium]